METLLPVLTLVAGFVLGWLIRHATAPDPRAEHDRLAADLHAAQHVATSRATDLATTTADLAATIADLAAARADARAIREQLELVREDREQLVAQFKAQAGDVLKDASKDLARQQLERQAEREAELVRERRALAAAADQEQKARAEAIALMVKPLADKLAGFDEKVERLEGARRQQAGALDTQLKALGEGVGLLGQNADRLVTALRRPNVRGAWGELQLRTAFEHAGLVEGVNYTLQHTVAGEQDARLRPDAVVNLPGGKSVVVDAKVPYEAYGQACEATEPDEIAGHMAHHARQVRAHVKALAGKDYQSALRTAAHATPDFVVMFIPSEAMFFAALETDRTLLEDAMKLKVLIAAPMSLIAILQAVHVGWQQEQIAEDAQAIATIATDLHQRFATFFEHHEAVGRALGQAVEKYNRSVATYEGRLVPQFRRLEDHQIKGTKALLAGRKVEAGPRVITKGLTIEAGAA